MNKSLFTMTFEEFKQQIQFIQELNLEGIYLKVSSQFGDFIPSFLEFYLDIQIEYEKNNKNYRLEAQLIYNQMNQIPSFYFLISHDNNYIQPGEVSRIHENNHFVLDQNPISGISMCTMHNCQLSEFLRGSKDEQQNEQNNLKSLLIKVQEF